MSIPQRLAQQKGKQKILVNATHPEEMRIAIVFGTELFDLEIEQRNVGHQQQNNIYKGRVAQINSSLNAAFVDFGADRDGFLPMKHVAAEFIPATSTEPGASHSIDNSLHEGQELVVQVDKEERDGKGAALTTLVRLPGRSLVLSPNDPRAHGVSRRLRPQEREAALQMLRELEVPDGMSVVLRSSAAASSVDQLRVELQALTRQWEDINAAAQQPAPQLLLREDDVLVRVLRDWLTADTDQVLLDTAEALEHAARYVRIVAPEHEAKLQLYENTRPLFNRYHVERQISSAYQRRVPLPAGGDIVLDRTEAMTVIDVNSSSTKGKGIEEVALTANVEAVAEIARQLRLRDIGGLVVIDFIDMGSEHNRHTVESAMEAALAEDRTRIHCGRISRFGLLEMTRKRLRPSLREQRDILCPRCDGNGSVRPSKQQALDLLRLIEEEAASRPQAREVHVLAPIGTAAIFYNDYRDKLSQLEREFHLRIQLFPDPDSARPHHRFYGEKDQVPTSEDALERPGTEERLQHRVEQQRIAAKPPRAAAVQSEQAWATVSADRASWWRRPISGLRLWLQSDSADTPSTNGQGVPAPGRDRAPATRRQPSSASRRSPPRERHGDARRRRPTADTHRPQTAMPQSTAHRGRGPRTRSRAESPPLGNRMPPSAPPPAPRMPPSALPPAPLRERAPSDRVLSDRAANNPRQSLAPPPSSAMPPPPESGQTPPAPPTSGQAPPAPLPLGNRMPSERAANSSHQPSAPLPLSAPESKQEPSASEQASHEPPSERAANGPRQPSADAPPPLPKPAQAAPAAPPAPIAGRAANDPRNAGGGA